MSISSRRLQKAVSTGSDGVTTLRTIAHGEQLLTSDVGPWALQGVEKGNEAVQTLAAPSRGYWRFDTPDEFLPTTAWPADANDSNPSILNNPTLRGGVVSGSPVMIDGYSIPVGTRIVQFRDFQCIDFYANGSSSFKILLRGCRLRSNIGVGGAGIFNDSTSGSGQQIMVHFCDIGLSSADPVDGSEGLMHLHFVSGSNHRILRNYHTISATFIQPNAPGVEITENYIDNYLYPYGEGGIEGTLPNPNAGHLNGISTEGQVTSLKILRNRIVAPSPDGATGSTGTALGQIGYGTQPGQTGYGNGSAPGRKITGTDCIALFANVGDNHGSSAGAIQVSGNYLGGSGFCLYVSGSTSSNITVTDNKVTTRWWTNGGSFGPSTTQLTWGSNGNIQSGNVWADDYGTGGDGTTAVANRQYPSGNGPRAGQTFM